MNDPKQRRAVQPGGIVEALQAAAAQAHRQYELLVDEPADLKQVHAVLLGVLKQVSTLGNVMASHHEQLIMHNNQHLQASQETQRVERDIERVRNIANSVQTQVKRQAGNMSEVRKTAVSATKTSNQLGEKVSHLTELFENAPLEAELDLSNMDAVERLDFVGQLRRLMCFRCGGTDLVAGLHGDTPDKPLCQRCDEHLL